jgi:hypothetical protein
MSFWSQEPGWSWWSSPSPTGASDPRKQGLRPVIQKYPRLPVYSLRIIIHFKEILPVFLDDPIPSKRGYLK